MNKRAPRVSIGLPVYNGEKYLAETVESLLLQTFEDFELIISDNASTDATEEICRGFAARDRRVGYVRQPANRGPAWNFNHVFERAAGDYFRWAAHDDLCAPEHLARCVEVLDRDPSVILAYPRTAVIDEKGELVAEDGFPHWPEPERPDAPYLHDDGYPRQLDSRRPSTRYFGILALSNRCYEVFGLVRSASLRRTGLHGDYCGAEKVLLAELSLAGRFEEIPQTLFFSRWHSERFSANPSSLEQHRNYRPDSRRRPIIPRQVRCSWGYLRAIHKADLCWREKARCHLAFARYLCQLRKWKRAIVNAARRVDTTAEIPTWAKRLGRPPALADLATNPDLAKSSGAANQPEHVRR